MKRLTCMLLIAAALLLFVGSVSATELDSLEEYQTYMRTNSLPEKHLNASSLAILGDLQHASIEDYRTCYTMMDINNFYFTVTMESGLDMLYAHGRDEIRSIPANADSMYKIDVKGHETPFVYVRDGVYYTFYADGTLYCIEWFSDEIAYRIGDFITPYPMDGKDTVLKGILSPSDKEAATAFAELTDYAQISIEPELGWTAGTWAGLLVIVLSAGSAVFLYIRGKRSRRDTPPFRKN